MIDEPNTAASAAKAGAVWAGVAVGHSTLSWAELASILASVYSMLLIVDWLWKKAKLWKRSRHT